MLYFAYRQRGEIYYLWVAEGRIDDPKCVDSKKFNTIEERALFLENEHYMCACHYGKKLMGPEELTETTSPEYEQFLSDFYRNSSNTNF